MKFSFMLVVFGCMNVGICNNLSTQDSTSDSKLIGLDFSFDFGVNQTNYNRELFFLNQLSSFNPLIQNFKPNYTNAYFNNTYNKVNFEMVYRVKPLLFKKRNLKQELKFGVSVFYNKNLQMSNASIYYDSLASDNIMYEKYLGYNYRVSGQQLGLTYIINSKVFAKNFASYIGMGAVFSLNSLRGTKNSNFYVSNYKNDTSLLWSSINIENTLNTTSYSLFIPLGIKYNFSCEVNLFLDVKFGLNFTPQLYKIDHFNRFNSLALGFRYKLNQKDVLQNKQSSFW
ncbi:MAG: hypothetical protein Q8K70_11590 [Bacteroidota bacterium]|nr:hypothetical protein [Bacteroidota bacterium]